MAKKKKNISVQTKRKKKKTLKYTIPSNCQWDGTASRSRTGFISYMALVSNIHAKYAAILFIWDGKRLIVIFRFAFFFSFVSLLVLDCFG